MRDFRGTHIWTREGHPHKISKRLKSTSSSHVENIVNMQEWLRRLPQTCRRLCGILLPIAVGREQKVEEEVCGLQWVGVRHVEETQHLSHACTSSQEQGFPDIRELLPPSQLRTRAQNLGLLSAKYCHSLWIQCSMHPLSPRRAHQVTGLLRLRGRLQL